MADHDLVDEVITFLATNWDAENYPLTDGAADQKPVLIDRDDSTVYEITESGTAEVGDSVGVTFEGRSVTYELTKNNAISVSSAPDRSETPIGTEYDYRVEDGVSVRIEGAHESEFGHLADAQEFEALYKEARRAILVERTWPLRNPDGDEHYHTLETANATNLSTGHADYYRWDVDVLFRGYEELP